MGHLLGASHCGAFDGGASTPDGAHVSEGLGEARWRKFTLNELSRPLLVSGADALCIGGNKFQDVSGLPACKSWFLHTQWRLVINPKHYLRTRMMLGADEHEFKTPIAETEIERSRVNETLLGVGHLVHFTTCGPLAKSLPFDLLCPGSETKKQGEKKNDRKPDPPHGHLGWGWLTGV
jgi:hypothetical protein